MMIILKKLMIFNKIIILNIKIKNKILNTIIYRKKMIAILDNLISNKIIII